ncbi:unnamed protein product, partial [Closterium sp. NIES-53]
MPWSQSRRSCWRAPTLKPRMHGPLCFLPFFLQYIPLQVKYQAEEFLVKNLDALVPEHEELLARSHSEPSVPSPLLVSPCPLPVLLLYPRPLQVKYQAEEFLVKNLDALVPEHEELLARSHSDFVRTLFPPPETGKAVKAVSLGKRFK